MYLDTPTGTKIDWQNPEDAEFGVFLQDDALPESSVVHVENIVFNEPARPGVYKYGVALWDRRGEKRDKWRLSVTVDGVEVAVHEGKGTSRQFMYTQPPVTVPVESPPLVVVPTEPTFARTSNVYTTPKIRNIFP